MRCRNGRIRIGSDGERPCFEFWVSSFELLIGEVDVTTVFNSKLETQNSKTLNESWELRSIRLWSERTDAAVRVAALPLL